MNQKEIDHKIGIIEKVGESVGFVIGKVFKSPFKLVAFIVTFLFVAVVAFIYALKTGAARS